MPSETAALFTELGLGDTVVGDHRLSLELEPLPGAARRARELVTEACARWDRPGLTGDACVVVTEMVNNVVAHVHTPMLVLLALHGETMTIAVRDGSVTPPRLAGPAPVTVYGGRGLVLIDAIALDWGHFAVESGEAGDGKVVWARTGPRGPA